LIAPITSFVALFLFAVSLLGLGIMVLARGWAGP
jgi:hypothetical protein